MNPRRLALAVIGDEIGPSLDEMISFCAEHDVRRLDMRTVEGRNLLSMQTDEVVAISRRLDQAGLIVPTFVSPVFKWAAPGTVPLAGKVDFAFDPRDCPVSDPLQHAMDVSVILDARNMRIFSYLRHDGFQTKDLSSPGSEFERLIGLAVHFDITLQLENEPVCNIGNIAELSAFFTHETAEKDQRELGDRRLDDEEDAEDLSAIRLRPLVDIANAWSTGETPSDANIARLAPMINAIHVKDRSQAAGRITPLGEGDVPWPAELRRLLGGAKVEEVLASIETHCPEDGRNATARSVKALRRLASEIGVEVV